MNLGGPELLIVVGLAVLIFGAGWLPKAARNLGKAKVEFDKTTQQLTEAKEQMIEATGVKELDATIKKANKALNTTPQGMLKGAAASALKPTAKDDAATDDAGSEDAGSDDEGIEDAEIVEDSASANTAGSEAGVDDANAQSDAIGDTNLTVDFSD